MISTSITIINPTGIHTRPGSSIAKKAKEFNCDIKVQYGTKIADAKSMLQLLKLGLEEGSTADLICDGDDEQMALREMELFISALIE